MLVLRKLRVRSLDLDVHEISWELEDTTEDVFDYTFEVLRSESPSGPFEKLGEPFEDRYAVFDDRLQVAHRWRTYFYLVRVTRKRTGEVRDFGPTAKEPEADLIALELRRHMNLLFREFGGRRAWVLPVRTFGPRCTCWNPTLSQRRRSGCITCFDTGFVRGYLSPIESWVQMDPSPKTEQTLQTGAAQTVNTTARLGFYPPCKPRDVLVESENRRWRVVQASQTEHGRARVHQEVTLHEIPPKDIEYAIPLRLELALRDLWLSPPRNFTAPHHLGAAGQDSFPDPLRLYRR